MKVLVVRVGAMGDVLHALPAVAALQAARPQWEIGWVVDPRWAPLVAAMDTDGQGPYVRRVHRAETKAWSAAPLSMATARSVLALRRELRAERYDLAIDVQGTLRSAVIGGFAKARRLVGFADPREALAARAYDERVVRCGVHVVEQNAALVSAASGVALTPAAVDLPREGWAEEWAQELVAGRRMALLAAGGGWAAKHWPAERYGALARELVAIGYEVVVNAGRKDDALAARVVAASGGAARIVVCNVTGLIALVRRMALVVGGDTGPVHLAAALGVPLVALFGPTSPERNGPWGAGPKAVLRDAAAVTSYKRSSEADAGLEKIGVEQVMQAVRGLGGKLLRE